MVLITDPDDLDQNEEIFFDTANKTIQLVKTSILTDDGVTLQCLYSSLKDQWKTDANLIKFPFPMIAITEEKFELVSGWDFKDDTTKNLIRTGGWALKDATYGHSLEEYSGTVTLGSIGANDQVYYQQHSTGSATNIVLTGSVNQAAKIYDSGSFDYRDYFKIFVREYAKTYGMSQLSDIGVSTMTYQVYRFPLANAADLKIADIDSTVDTGSAYASMFIAWSGSAAQRSIGGTPYNFHVFINGANGTAEQIYTYVQRKLRLNADIDSGSGAKIGKVTSGLLNFVGDSLYTLLYSASSGSYIDNFQTADTNRLYFTDDTNTVLQFPFVAALSVQFGENLINDANAKYWVYFTNDDAGYNSGSDYGTANAIIVKDNNNVDMTYSIGGSGSMQLSYDFDNNIQRGTGSNGDNAPITVVAIGLSTAQFVKATGTIVRSVGNVASLVAPLERNYSNV